MASFFLSQEGPCYGTILLSRSGKYKANLNFGAHYEVSKHKIKVETQ
jgi:hypothetical protein